MSEDEKYNILLTSLPYDQMLHIAEELALRKRDVEGHVRTFLAADEPLFASARTPDALFSQSEQILFLKYRLDGMKPDGNFDEVVGNDSLLEWCKRQHYLDDVFLLHHRASANAIMAELSWSSPLLDVGGISKLQDYFGDKVALYFAFLTFYTKALVTFGVSCLFVYVLCRLFERSKPLVLFAYSIFMNMAYLHVAFIRRDYQRLGSSIRSVLLVELVMGTSGHAPCRTQHDNTGNGWYRYRITDRWRCIR